MPREITTNKADLILRITHNRDEHRAKFLKAQAIYRARVIEELDRILADAREHKDVNLHLGLPQPRDHTSDYDNAIEMLTLHIEDTITLTDEDIRTLIRNDWRWMSEFTSTNAVYAVK